MSKISLYGQSTRSKEYLTALLLIILVGMGEYVGWTTPVAGQTQRMINPILAFEAEIVRVVYWPFESLFVGYHSAEQLRTMQNKFAAQSAELHELAKLRRENQTLRGLLENSDRTLEDRKIASPVVSLAYPAVASGTKHGVSQGGMVTFQNTLLGVVTQVSEHQARVALLTKKDSLPVLAKTENGVQGIVVGDGKRVRLTEIPHSAEVNKGDRVVTVGQEGIKRDVLIGTIREVETRPSAPTQTAIIEQLVSFYDAPVVEIW